MVERIPTRQLPGGITHVDEMERAALAPHHVCDPIDGCMTVYPANSFTFGELAYDDTSDMLPTIRLKTLGYPTALVYVPSAEELRLIGTAFIETAKRMEKKASDDAAAALGKAMKGGA